MSINQSFYCRPILQSGTSLFHLHGSRRSPRRPPSIFVPAVHLKSGVGQLVALTFKGVGYPAENGTMILTGPSTTNTSFVCSLLWNDQGTKGIQHASNFVSFRITFNWDYAGPHPRCWCTCGCQAQNSKWPSFPVPILGVQACCLDVKYSIYTYMSIYIYIWYMYKSIATWVETL